MPWCIVLQNLFAPVLDSQASPRYRNKTDSTDIPYSCKEIVRLLIKYKADGMKSNPTEEEKNDWILRISKRTQSYRYSKLLGLYLLDTIDESNSADSIIRTLYMYAASKSDESGVFLKME